MLLLDELLLLLGNLAEGRQGGSVVSTAAPAPAAGTQGGIITLRSVIPISFGPHHPSTREQEESLGGAQKT